MIAIIRKELSSFFSSSIGYLVIGVFLLISGLFLWLIKGPYNLIDNGFADLQPFFTLAPWILLFLISAVCMRLISEERKQGTMEILATKPLSTFKLVMGKYLSAVILVILALIPSLIYVYSINQLSDPIGNLDSGSTVGSYIGMLALTLSFCGIGIFCSSITQNQIVAFISSVILSMFFYLGFESLADLLSNGWIDQLGLDYHYQSVSQGVLDIGDIIYFLSLALLFVLLTVWRASGWGNKPMAKWWIPIILVIFIVLNLLSMNVDGRIDMTSDKRYTLNDTTVDLIEGIDQPVIIDVFLEGNDFPSEFRRLRTETKQFLEELTSINPNIKYSFINPIPDESSKERNIRQLSSRGMTPMQLSVQEAGSLKQSVIFPWALASYGEVTTIIPLVKNKMRANQQIMVNNSVQQLEYSFADGLNKLVFPKRKKIAVLRGNGQLPNRNIADIITDLRESYFIAPFTLDSVEVNPEKSLEQLKQFDLIINAKPTEAFTENEILVLDQFIMNGGKSLWLLEEVAIDMDSLNNESGNSIAIPFDLNLRSILFKYGLRINPVLVNDMYGAPISLYTGEGSQAQEITLPWFYSPLSNTDGNDHPVVRNLSPVKFDFANPIDTLRNSINKTILLKSSLLSKIDGTPREISLAMAAKEPDPQTYKAGEQNLAVLLEGEFTSYFENKILPFELTEFKSKASPTAMVVISDGDVIKNEVRQNQPVELGFEPTSGEFYGNKEFIMNTVNYLLDENGLIALRSKDLNIAFLDRQKATEEKTKWQIINLGGPLMLLAIFGFIFKLLRRRKYGL